MTGRDRMVAIGLSVLALLAAGWILVVSPEREKASKQAAQIASAKAQLSSAEGQLSSARSAQAQYASAYASIVSLGKAVPPTQEVPSLIYQLSQAANGKYVEFSSISSGSTGTAASATAAASASAAAASFTQMPFTFVFNGSFFDLEHLFHQLDSFASTTSSGAIQVRGRLLTIQSIKLSPTEKSSSESGPSGNLSGTITATAYELPAGQGLTGSGSAAAPAGAVPSATSPTTSSSPAAPAIVKVNP